MSLRLLPSFGIRSGDARPVLRRVQLQGERLAVDCMPRVFHPRCDVQREFPNAVRIRNRLRSCLLGGYSVEYVAYRWTVPCVAFKGLVKLLGNEFEFGHQYL